MHTKELPRQAQLMKALGDPTRLEIFAMLCSCSTPLALESSGGVRPIIGPTAGEICCQITGEERINSRISFHLKELRQAGLISVERRGKHMVCAIIPETLAELRDIFEHLLTKVSSPKRKASCKTKQKKNHQ